VRREGALARTVVVAEPSVPARRRTELFASLAARGLEVSAKHVRVPVVSQLAGHLAGGTALTMRSLERAVRGATKRDVADAAAALVEAKEARWVARAKEVALVDAGAAVLDERSYRQLEEALAQLLVSIRTARSKRASLLRADVEQALLASEAPHARQRAEPNADDAPHARQRAEPNEAGPDQRPAASLAASGPSAADLTANDVTAIIAAHRERSGLTFVPKIVRVLGGPEACQAVHAELLRGARAGVFELRPESGMGRLSAEDAAFCIPGPQGSTLSWVRCVVGAQ
jgi:hypothetical protein